MLASIEGGGAEAIAFSSGCAAIATVLQSLGPNSHILSMDCVYGGTFRYMTQVAAENQGLETTFMDLEHSCDEDIYAAIKENTRVSTRALVTHCCATYLTFSWVVDLDRVPYEPYPGDCRHP